MQILPEPTPPLFFGEGGGSSELDLKHGMAENDNTGMAPMSSRSLDHQLGASDFLYDNAGSQPSLSLTGVPWPLPLRIGSLPGSGWLAEPALACWDSP